jgi:predicted exporter
MGYQLLASGSILDAVEVASYDDYLREGERGLLELDLRDAPSQTVVSQLRTTLQSYGVEDVNVSTGSPILRISYRKGLPWLAIIVAAVLILAILVVGWRFYKEVFPEGLPTPVSVGLIVAVLAAIVLVAWRRK